MSDSSKARSVFLALLALKSGAKHGYEIAAHIKQASGGFFSVSFGSLYPVLHKLEKEGLVKASWTDIGDVKRKKVYALTSRGQRALADETDHFRNMIRAFTGLLEAKA